MPVAAPSLTNRNEAENLLGDPVLVLHPLMLCSNKARNSEFLLRTPGSGFQHIAAFTSEVGSRNSELRHFRAMRISVSVKKEANQQKSDISFSPQDCVLSAIEI